MQDNSFLSVIKKSVPDYGKDESVKPYTISTGSYILNALIYGSIYGGIVSNRITALAGEEASGKTFLALSVVKQFIEEHKDGNVVYFDTENALDDDGKEFIDRGIDFDRVFLVRIDTVEDFKFKVLNILENYKALAKDKRTPTLFILDSLGNLSTVKEQQDSLDEKTTQDMTRARQIKSAFRTITQKLSRLNIPLLLTNHTYDVIGDFYGATTMSGGSGLKYCASTIVFFAKAKDRDNKDKKTVNGIIVRATIDKSRFTKTYKKVEARIDFTNGLDKYYGLFDVAEKYGCIEKLPSGSYTHPDYPTRKLSKQDFIREPEKFFTQPILDKIEEAVQKEFKFGTVPTEEEIDKEIENELNGTENIDTLKGALAVTEEEVKNSTTIIGD